MRMLLDCYNIHKGEICVLNFTVGPVQMSEKICSLGSEQIPYFRTPEFSKVMFENERLIKKFVGAKDNDRVVFLTGSGTASMEATIINTIDENDKVLVVNGGSFGQRFVEICSLHKKNFTEIKLNVGKNLTNDILENFRGKGYTAFVVNIHETSTGVYYDLELIKKFCSENNMFLIVDAISSFMADEIDFDGIDVLIIGSQKALACPPGISIIVMSINAIGRIDKIKCNCMYLDLKKALKDAERGQTPFTPAVGILLQINYRLNEVENNGGVKAEITRIKSIANDFRQKIVDLPFDIISDSMSNAVTPLAPRNSSAYRIFNILKDEYNIWVCPNGGELTDKLFRVGHIGELTVDDNDTLIFALKDIQKRGLLD